MSDVGIILVVFITCCAPIIILALLYYHKKKMEHTQIMTAIEKGTPLSELKPVKKPPRPGPVWITEYTTGITCLIIAAGFFLVLWTMLSRRRMDPFFAILYIVPIVFLANGVGAIMRSKILKKNHPDLENVPPEIPDNINTTSDTDIQSG